MKGRSGFNPLLTFLVALLATSAAAPSQAATDRYWTGSANDGNWNDASNWSSGAPVSGSDDSVYFLSTGTYIPSPNNNFSGTFSLKSLTFNSGAGAVTLGGNPIAFDMGVTGGGIYQNSANPVRVNNALSWTGNNTLTIKSQGAGGLTLAGGLSTTASGSLVTIGGGSVTFSTGTFGTGTNGNLRAGDNTPSSLTVQDNATLNVGNELDVNYQNTLGTASTLSLKSGAMNVTGQTIIGRANLRTGPSNTSAAFYQTGGVATLTGLLTVGYNGSAMSLLDIDAGTLNANGGFVVGDGAANHAGNGSVNIHGAGTVNVAGGSGLVIGQDSTLTTAGSLTLSSGALSVTGNLVLGGTAGGIGTFARSGGSLSVSGNLVVGGVATLDLDDTSASVRTAFGGTLSRSGNGTLVIVPQNGQLSGNEGVTFTTTPSSTNGIIGPWLVAQASGGDSTGTYLTCSGSQLAGASYTSVSGSHTTVTNELLDITGSSTLTDAGSHAWAMRVGPYTTTLANTITLGSGGLILNGGSASSARITGGGLAFNGNQALIYVGSSNPAVSGGTIESPMSGTGGLLKFGPGTLVLADSNVALSGTVTVATGTLRVANAGALGSGAATVAGGAAMELSSTTGIAVGNSVTLAGSGVSGYGCLRNVAGNNSISGTITLASDSQFNVDGGTLTLNGAVAGQSFNLTKAGSSTLVLADNSGGSFPGSLFVAAGTVRLQSNNALGTAGGNVTVNPGATVQLQGGIATASGESLNLSGTGSGSGSLENAQGNNVWAGSINLVADSTVGVDSAADTLNISGTINGNCALTKVGSGALQLSSTASSFSGPLSVLNGALNLSSVNLTGTNGPLGAGLLPVGLGSSGQTARFWWTGSTGSTDRGFTLAANGTGEFDVDSQSANLSLSGAIGGNGNLNKTGQGTLTLAGANSYLGTTTVSNGTLSLSGSGGSLASQSITVGSVLTIYNANNANNGNRLANNATLNLSGGTFNFSNDASAGNNFSESLGLLNAAAGNSTVNTAQAASGNTSILTLGAIAHSPGATVNFTGVGLGASTRNAITITGQPTGFIGAWAISPGTDWLKYAQIGSTGVYSVMSFASSDYTSHGESAWVSGDNVKLTGSTTSLSGSRTISSLNLAATAATTLNIPDGDVLHIDGGANGGNVGGILVSGSSATTIAANGTNGTGAITVGMPNQPGELLIRDTSSALLQISASITDNGAGDPVNLVVTGSGSVLLSGTNTFTGGMTLSGGTLTLASASALPSSGVLTICGGGRLVLGGGSGIGALLGASSLMGSGEGISLSAATKLQATGSLGDTDGAASWPQADPGGSGSSLAGNSVLPSAETSTSAVPEPSALALLAAGSIGLAIMAIRRRFAKRPIGG